MPEVAGVGQGSGGRSLPFLASASPSEDLHLFSKSPATSNALCLYNRPHDKVQVPSSTDKY